MRACLLLLTLLPPAVPAPLNTYEIKNLKTEGGATIGACQIGFRTFGKLDAQRSNTILFPTWFSGKSADLEQFMGSGKLVDTSRFYVVAVDALGNGVSCAPSNAGRRFPAITIGDMVQAEYRLLTEHLGIKKLHAVMGISMGGMQTFEWLTAYPGFMERAVPIVGSPKLTSSDMLLWQAEFDAIESVRSAGSDPRKAMPAVQNMHTFALTTPQHLAKENYPVTKASVDKRVRESMDPADWAAQLKAMMAQDVARHYGGSMEKAAAAVKARVLVVVATQDHMVNPIPALKFAEAGKFGVVKLEGECGHLSPDCEAAKMNQAVGAFLAK